MNRNDFRNPLIQSGILLLVVFLFISIVASAPADGFIAGIYALLSGLIKGLLFVIALSIGLIFSIAVLIGIFLLATSFHSVDKARTTWEHLKTALTDLYCKARAFSSASPGKPETSAADTQAATRAAVPGTETQETARKQKISTIEEKLNTFEGQLSRLQASVQSTEEQLAVRLSRLEEGVSATGPENRIAELEASSAELASTVKSQAEEVASVRTEISALADSTKADIDSLNRELAELHKKTSVPDVLSGILAYIDKQEDRDALTERAEEAVSRGMTYAQTDDFFKKSLPAEVHETLSEHPRLTKDFIRSIKKKFE